MYNRRIILSKVRGQASQKHQEFDKRARIFAQLLFFGDVGKYLPNMLESTVEMLTFAAIQIQTTERQSNG